MIIDYDDEKRKQIIQFSYEGKDYEPLLEDPEIQKARLLSRAKPESKLLEKC